MDELVEKIRPYNDEEVSSALHRIIDHPLFDKMLQFLYEEADIFSVKETLKNISSVSEYQKFFSDYAVKKTIEKTSAGLTYDGIENLSPTVPYLFISNHRDIVLDSAIMQIILLGNGHKTSQITFGSNLMSNQFVIDLGKLNKMFTFYRGGNRLEQYQHAKMHSAYIRHTLTHTKESVWIAQRDGRTKDGNDKTQTGLLKMLSLDCKDICTALTELNVVPLSISYEYEPCDYLKIRENYMSKHTKYVKAENEDFNSVLTGIVDYKGKIHVSFGTPLNTFLQNISTTQMNTNELIDSIVQEIDKQIYTNYKLHPIHYIAYDTMCNTNQFKNTKYSPDEHTNFVKYINDKVRQIDGNTCEIEKMFYSMYAMPVFNKLKVLHTE